MAGVLNTLPGATLALIFNAFVWGLSWWPLRLLQERGLHPLWATAIIFTVALLCLIVARPAAARGWWQQPWPQQSWLWALALASGITNVGFNWAVTQGDVVRGVLLFYLMPAWVVVLAWPLLGERPTRNSVARLALALSGVVIVLKSADTPWPLPHSLTDWLAILGGFCFALTNILLRKLRDTASSTRVLAMFVGGTLSAGAAALIGTAWGLLLPPPALQGDWVLLVVALSLAFLAGNVALQYGAARLSASSTSLIMLSEVLFASVSAVVLGAGELSTRTLIGGGLIVLAALWAANDG